MTTVADQPDDDRSTADQLFATGSEQYSAGRYQQSVSAFRRAQSIFAGLGLGERVAACDQKRYCQDLWMRVFQATSVSLDSSGSAGEMSMGRSSSLPLWNTAPARTSATRWGALTARQRACAASISL